MNPRRIPGCALAHIAPPFRREQIRPASFPRRSLSRENGFLMCVNAPTSIRLRKTMPNRSMARADCLGQFSAARGQQEVGMNQDRIAGKLKQLSGTVKGGWGRFTNNPLIELTGSREQVAGKFQERYGISKEQASLQLREFIHRNRNWDPSDR
jgi:uncharacterized protein YjbJ (UPF0337 family)